MDLSYASGLRDQPAAFADGDARILALEFDSQVLAQQALHAALAMQDEEILRVHDAVVLTGGDHGAEIVAHMDPSPVAAAVPGSLVGAVIGILLAGPVGLLVGGALGGGGGALAAKLADTGVPRHVVARLRDAARPGRYVLALLVSELRPGTLAGFAMRCGSVGRSTILPSE